ncbi:MAG: molybdopterin dinucleotide binding domain-containing protein, partial [Coriobacteriales bacterium]
HFGKAFHGKDFKWQSAEEFLDHDLKIHGISWDELKKDVTVQYTLGGYKKYERGMVRPDGQIGFNTPTGRVELYSLRYEALGDDPLPYYKRAPLDPEYNSYGDEYNLHMTTGARHYVSFHSEHRQIKSLRQLHPFPELEIHPKTAEKLGIRDGDDVRVENPWGSALLRAKLTPTIREDTVNADHGWWYPEEDGEEPNLFGVWKSNLNSMVPHKVIGKMGFGAPYKDLPVKVVKANGLTREQDFTTPEALSENKDWEYKNVVNPARSGYASKSSHKSKVEA